MSIDVFRSLLSNTRAGRETPRQDVISSETVAVRIVQPIELAADVRVGSNLVEIEPDQVLDPQLDLRPLAFILDHLRPRATGSPGHARETSLSEADA